MNGSIGATAEAAIQRALRELATVPGFKGAVLLYLTPDAKGLAIKSTLPGNMTETLIAEAAAFVNGARGSKIIVAAK